MEPPFPDHFVEQPVAIDIASGGRMLVVDRGGRRVCVGEPGGKPVSFRPPARTICARFVGDHLLLLGEDDFLRTVAADGSAVGETKVRAGALRLAVTGSGGVLLSYGRRGTSEHGVTLERLGVHPFVHEDPALLDATALAVESGALWIAGTGSDDPATRAVRLRPTRTGVSALGVVALPAPPRAAAVGPDGALYVVLEPGESLVRVSGDVSGPVRRLPAPATDVALGHRSLWSCGARGLRDLTYLVPPPEGDGPDFQLPACSP